MLLYHTLIMNRQLFDKHTLLNKVSDFESVIGRVGGHS